MESLSLQIRTRTFLFVIVVWFLLEATSRYRARVQEMLLMRRSCRRCFEGQCDEIGIDLLGHLQFLFVVICFSSFSEIGGSLCRMT